jgi:hypothetical protein
MGRNTEALRKIEEALGGLLEEVPKTLNPVWDEVYEAWRKVHTILKETRA